MLSFWTIYHSLVRVNNLWTSVSKKPFLTPVLSCSQWREPYWNNKSNRICLVSWQISFQFLAISWYYLFVYAIIISSLVYKLDFDLTLLFQSAQKSPLLLHPSFLCIFCRATFPVLHRPSIKWLWLFRWASSITSLLHSSLAIAKIDLLEKGQLSCIFLAHFLKKHANMKWEMQCHAVRNCLLCVLNFRREEHNTKHHSKYILYIALYNKYKKIPIMV